MDTALSPKAVFSQSRVCAVAWAVPNPWDTSVPGLAPPRWGCSAPPCPRISSWHPVGHHMHRAAGVQASSNWTEEVEMTFQHPTLRKKLPGLEMHHGHCLSCECPTLQPWKPFGVAWWCTVIPISMAILLLITLCLPESPFPGQRGL